MALENFGGALASFWDDFGVMLWSPCASGDALGSDWGTFGSLWDHFGFTLGAFGGPVGT